jgi:serine/threonine protein kinase
MATFRGLTVGDPIPFPNPAIRPSSKGKALVYTDDDEEDDFNRRYHSDPVPEERPVLIVQEHYYEVSEEPIRKAIFGQVLFGILLELTGQHSHGNQPIFRRSSTEVAIKVYYRDRLRSLQGRTQENPLMEITALQYLGDGHPGIVGQLECAMDSDNIYSIMRFYQGGELFDRISSLNSPMNEDQARHFFHQLVSALQRFQQLGIAHRDMSLENILCKQALDLDSDNHAELLAREQYAVIDFGMCLRLPPHPTVPGVFLPIKRQPACGKRNYIAPEVLAQTEFFEPMLVDIWASGIILFMVLTGVPPIDIASPSDDRYNMVADGRLAEMVLSWGYDFLSVSVLDLIQGLLRAEPTQRLTLPQILAHPWMRIAPSTSSSLMNSGMDVDR